MMDFLDGVLIASCFWFFVCLACLLRGMSYGWNDFDIPRLNWSDGWSGGWDAGYKHGVDVGLDHGYDAGFQAGIHHDCQDQRQNACGVMKHD